MPRHALVVTDCRGGFSDVGSDGMAQGRGNNCVAGGGGGKTVGLLSLGVHFTAANGSKA
jgi:hypothetical protein